ncbi:BrnT family toxin [Thiomicrospira microaerophila]|nr:BrnT family toxin [Thiomicrospira microaerophila]
MLEYDKTKRLKTLNERGLDFADAEKVFEGVYYTLEDTRQDYGET